MAIDPLSAVADLANTVVGRLWPDKSEAERQQLAAALSIVQGQLEVNRAEAGSSSAFVGGWRPGIGWVCALALGMQYLARPLLTWAAIVAGHPLPELPGIDSTLWELMLGMLGLGGLRSYEKVKGVAS